MNNSCQPIKHTWYPISISRNVNKNKINTVRFNSKDYILYRDKNEEIVFRNRWCPHRGADMSDGILNQDCISCPYHGWEFNNSNGNIHSIPSNTLKNVGRCNNRVNIGRNRYVYDDCDLIWYYYSSDDNDKELSCPITFPDLKLQFDLDSFHITQGEIMVDSNWINVVENSIDPSHPNFVHENSFSDEDYTAVKYIEPPMFSERTHIMKSVCEIYHKTRNNVLLDGLNILKNRKLPNTIGKIPIYFEMNFPNITSIKFKRGNTTINTIVSILPIDDVCAKIFWYFAQDYVIFKQSVLKELLDFIVTNAMNTVLKEDIHILENLRYNRKFGTKEIFVDADKMQLLFRKKLNKKV